MRERLRAYQSRYRLWHGHVTLAVRWYAGWGGHMIMRRDNVDRETTAQFLTPDTDCAWADASRVRLRDGACVLLRGAMPEDAPRLSRMFFQLSDETRYFYFFSGVPLTEHWARRFTALGVADGASSYALVAQVSDDIVGIARFDREPNGHTAEVGILLMDGWQSRGLGQHMLRRLAEEARRRAITGFTGRVLGENRRALALGRRVFGGLRVTWASGEFELLTSFAPELDEPDRMRDE